MTAAEKNKALVREMFEKAFSAGDLGFLDAVISPDYLDHNTVPDQAPGAAGVKARFAGLRAAFPDLRFVLEEVVAEGAMVAARSHWTGTHRAVFLGIAPTGRRIAVAVMDFYRFEGGRIVEHWANVDEFGMLSQLGDLG